ncbi:MAG TPA: protein O-GlcNAcase [Jatrophihabitans sp.]|nr:protein O-GlcNAcase [Jatrophihabitans sp.]
MPAADLAALRLRGTIEGFYGPPWTHAQRLAHLAFSAEAGFNTFVYAPKDDPFHRARWREPYPEAELSRLAELTRAADGFGLDLICALHPALDMRFSDDADQATLVAKAAQLHAAGVSAFALLFDDVPQQLSDPADIAAFGSGPAGCGAAHGATCAQFTARFLSPREIARPPLVCPTDYAGLAASPYRDAFARTAPDDVVITWTGADIVVGSVSRADIDAAAASYRRRLVLWDNFPVNDFEPSRLFLGPLAGRTSDLRGAPLHGVIANAMIEAVPSRISLATVADWAVDPAGYEPARSAATAITRLGAESLAPLVHACSAWPPSADQDPELSTAVAGALDGDAASLAVLEARLTELAESCRSAAAPADLVAALRPWLAGALATAEAGLAAAQLLRSDAGVSRTEVRAALDRAESHYANVLRPLVPSFVRAVLDRFASPASAGPVALLVGAEVESTGDRATREYLEQHGFAVRRAPAPGDECGIDDVSVAVVTRTADRARLDPLREIEVPVIAWNGLVELGLASASTSVLLREPLTLADGSALAAFAGPAWSTVADVAAEARVFAHESETGLAAIFGYDAGARLADDTRAPAPRLGLFLGRDGPARWLLTDAGRSLVADALRSVPARTSPR